MKLFEKHKYNNLSEAISHCDNCTLLDLQFITYNLVDKGRDFLKLQCLTDLYIQGDPIIYEDQRFELPKEIGQLKNIQKLTLLNLPLKTFPDWILNLSNLNYLTVRGTDITFIPNGIIFLSKLKNLRVENCNLQTLPTGLSQMHQLKNLGLCDTRLIQIKASMFPSNLKQLDLSGTGCYNMTDLRQLKSELKLTRISPNVD